MSFDVFCVMYMKKKLCGLKKVGLLTLDYPTKMSD